MQVLAFNLTPDQVRDLGNVFREIDKDRKGTISLDDLKVRGSQAATLDSTPPLRTDSSSARCYRASTSALPSPPHSLTCGLCLLQTFVLNDKSDMAVPTSIEEEITAIYDNVTKNRAAAGAQINYNEFVAAVMWRRIQYDEEKVGAYVQASGGLSLLDGTRANAAECRQPLVRDSHRRWCVVWLPAVQMRMVFEALDVNRQGFLTPDSIRHVVRAGALTHRPSTSSTGLFSTAHSLPPS